MNVNRRGWLGAFRRGLGHCFAIRPGVPPRARPLDQALDLDARLPWCVGCPDHEGCSQGMCHLNGGPIRPEYQSPEEGA